MTTFEAALRVVEQADKHLLGVVASNADEQTYRSAYDAKARAIAHLDAVLSGAVVEVVQLAEAA